jgi:cytochrome c
VSRAQIGQICARFSIDAAINIPLKGVTMSKKLLVGFAIALGFACFPAIAQEGNAENGEDVFKKCRACHEVGPDAKNKLGPILNGIVGRKAGTIEGFNYSPANKKAGEDGWTWTEAKILEYLTNPRQAMPGNRMAFAGLSDEQDRKDVLAYLKKFSK